MKEVDIKLKYPSERTKAINSVLSKRGTTLETELVELLNQLYKKNVKVEVREFIAELENEEEIKKITKQSQKG